MRGIHAATLTALSLLLVSPPLVSAAFTDTFVHEDNPILGVDAADTTVTSIESIRHFSIDNPSVPVYVTLTGNEGEATYLSEAGYVVDIYLSKDDGASWTQVAQGVSTTDPSASLEMTNADQPAVRFVLHFPSERTARVVDVAFLIALDEASTAGGNGGVQNPAFRHSIDLYFYGAASDLDGDGLPDAWEYEHFGDLDESPNGDPDGDGYTNQEEFTAGTDPLSSGGGGGPGGGGGIYSPPSGLLYLALLSEFLLGLAVLGGIVLAKRRMGRGFTDQRVLRVWLPSAILMLGVFVTLWLLEAAPNLGTGWAGWLYPGSTTGEIIYTITALIVVLLLGIITAARQPQHRQGAVAVRVVAALAVVAASSLLLFGFLDVPTPFTT